MTAPDRVVYFDLETTGTDPWRDRIVEFCFVPQPRDPLAYREVYRSLVNPRRLIPAEATAVHGITDADVVNRPPFGSHAEFIQDLVGDAVLVGYNCRRFDTIVLHQELRAAGQLGLRVDERERIVHPEIDLFAIWRAVEPRDLATAVARFAGVDLEAAHTATADTEALPGVLAGMVDAFGLPGDVAGLQALTTPANAVDRDGKFVRDEDGRVLLTIGNAKGQPVHKEVGFLRWMLSRDFSPDTLGWVRLFLEAMDRGANPHLVR